MPRTRIFIADRNPSMLEMLIDLLGEEFEIVGTAQSGTAAVAECAALTPDILIVDVAVEDISGFEAARRLNPLSPNTKLVYFSMFESMEFVESAFANAASAYVFKSRDEDLVPALRKVAQGGTFCSSSCRTPGKASVLGP